MSRRDKSAGAPAVEAPPAQPEAPEVLAETAPVDPETSAQATSAVEPEEPPAPKRKATAAGHTLCKVVSTDIFYRSNLIAEGTIAEFDDGTVLAMPTVLVPVE